MDIPVCKDRDKYKKQLRETQKYVDFFKLECDRETNKIIKSYFGPEKYTHKALLEALFNLVKSKPESHSFSFLDFLNMFSRDTAGQRPENKKKEGGFNFKRPHVFEAICRAMLVLNYDKNYWGEKKEFFTKLEDWGESEESEGIESILDKNINEGNQAGSVDIFFEFPNLQNPVMIMINLRVIRIILSNHQPKMIRICMFYSKISILQMSFHQKINMMLIRFYSVH